MLLEDEAELDSTAPEDRVPPRLYRPKDEPAASSSRQPAQVRGRWHRDPRELHQRPRAFVFRTTTPLMKNRLRSALVCIGLLGLINGSAQSDTTLQKKDRKRDVRFSTTQGVMVLRLSDSTPLHRDNFLRLVKSGYYDSTLFHRVIKNFMIQGGDPNSKQATPRQPLGNGGPAALIFNYTRALF